jgi:hypothetical protein
MTGPGTVPLYVQAGKKTPGAISRSRSIARIRYSRTRPGWCGRRVEQLVEERRPPDRGSGLADHRRMPLGCVVVDVVLKVPRVVVRARGGRVAEGIAAEQRRRDDRCRAGQQLATRKFRHA